MLRWALIFFIVALLAAFLGFGGVAGAASGIAQILFFVFLVLFAIAMVFAANCSFASPMGYQTNLLVMGPGHYKFQDFVRAGANLTDEQKERILHVIKFHEEYDFTERGKTVNDVETLIVQDADNLDGMGAMSVARSFSYGAINKIPMWTPEIPFNQDVYDESKLDHSTVHHFYSKALKLKDNMNTKTAQKMAKHRHKFLKLFLQEFFDEWSGEK